MSPTEFEELKNRFVVPQTQVHYVQITDEEIAALTKEQAEELVVHLGANALVTLQQKERDFFEWVRIQDPTVWEDLWGGDEEPYLVSISFLPELLPKRRGFPICDLADQQNFYFGAINISGEEGKPYLDAALDVVSRNGKLAMEQAFVVEVWRAPIDQWRFAYTYNVPLAEVKKMIIWLLKEEILEFYKPEESSEETDDEFETDNN